MGWVAAERRVVLEIWFEEPVPKALGYEEASLVATARGEERKHLIELLMGKGRCR